jgi:putative serine protease PepD
LPRADLALLVVAAAVVGCTAAEDEPRPPVPGVVESLQGHIVTNAHVVGTASAFEVRLAGSSTIQAATLVHSHPSRTWP